MFWNRNKGFTLIEVMITTAIIGVLAYLAIANYQKYVRRTRRGDGMLTLLSIQQAEERYRASNTTYGTLAQVWSNVATSPDGHYTLSITNNTATNYTLTANAAAGDDQLNDTEGATACANLTLTIVSGVATKAPAACWR